MSYSKYISAHNQQRARDLRMEFQGKNSSILEWIGFYLAIAKFKIVADTYYKTSA